MADEFQHLKLGIRWMIQRVDFAVRNSGFAPRFGCSPLLLH
jgi:hypothetical protein